MGVLPGMSGHDLSLSLDTVYYHDRPKLPVMDTSLAYIRDLDVFGDDHFFLMSQ